MNPEKLAKIRSGQVVVADVYKLGKYIRVLILNYWSK